MPSPFHTYAGILERAPHLVHMYLQNDPQVQGYQFWVAPTINDAYGNPAASGVGGAGATALFQVPKDGLFRSERIRRRGLALIPENRRGTTHAVFDFDDYAVAGASLTLSPNEQYNYIRVQENRVGPGLLNFAGNPADPVLGPLYMVPPVEAYGMSGPSFTTTGTAPSATGCLAGSPPRFSEDLTVAGPRPLVLVMPVPLREFTLANTDGVKNLLVATGLGQPMMTVPAGTEMQLFATNTKMFVLACPDAGGCPFSLHGILDRG